MPENEANFDETVKKFQVLLKKSGYSGKIVWVSSADMLLTGKRFVYVRVPLTDKNLAKARETYERGLASGSGVLLSTVCEMDGVVCCCAWSPERYEDGPQGLWSRGLKISASTEESKIQGRAVQIALWWRWLNWRLRKKQSLKEFLFQ